jgi:hypothetical protein
MSDRSLTGYDNVDAESGLPDEEVYLYDAQTSQLACASCDPSGARPVGVEAGSEGSSGQLQVGSALTSGTWFAGYLPPWTTERHQSRYLSDSGRLFFDSSSALVPQDINGKVDVYEYEPAGLGNCGSSGSTLSPVSGGCVGLISSGTSLDESAFLEASETGNDVFFLTTEKLVGQDVDTALDVYDAHVCSTGWSCVTASVSSPACVTADSCRSAPVAQPPIFGSPSSATFSGAGNVSTASPVQVVRPKLLTRAQKLASALKACRKKPKRKLAECRQKARKLYGVKRARTGSPIGKGKR